MCAQVQYYLMRVNVKSDLFVITQLSITPVLFSRSLTALICILDETKKLRVCLSISHSAIIIIIIIFYNNTLLL